MGMKKWVSFFFPIMIIIMEIWFPMIISIVWISQIESWKYDNRWKWRNNRFFFQSFGSFKCKLLNEDEEISRSRQIIDPWFNFQFPLSSRINRTNLTHLSFISTVIIDGFENKPRRRDKRWQLNYYSIVRLIRYLLNLKKRESVIFHLVIGGWLWKKIFELVEWWCLPELQIVYQKPRFSFRLLFFPPSIGHLSLSLSLSASILLQQPIDFPCSAPLKIFIFRVYLWFHSTLLIDDSLKRVVLLPRYRR